MSDKNNDVMIIKGDAHIEDINRTLYLYIGENKRYALSFKAAYRITHNDSDGLKDCVYSVNGREMKDLSFAEGSTANVYSKDIEMRVSDDKVKFLYFYNDIPTFDSYDRIWDGDEYIVIYKDSKGIELIKCRFGYRVGNIDIYRGLESSKPELSEWTDKL